MPRGRNIVRFGHPWTSKPTHTAAVALRRIPAAAKPEHAAAGAAMLVTGLVAEVIWTAKRRLPALEGIDVSGRIGTYGLPVRLVALGDSTLTGPGVSDPSQVWLHRALGRLAGSPSVELISLAAGGSRVADVATRLDEAVDLGPDLVVLAVGANDAIHATPTQRFDAQLRAMLERLTDEVAVVAVANIGDLGNIARVHRPLDLVLRRRSQVFSRTVERAVADIERAVLLDVTAADDVFRDRSVFAADLFHPGEDGHAAWADSVLPGLQLAFDQLRAGTDSTREPHDPPGSLLLSGQ